MMVQMVQQEEKKHTRRTSFKEGSLAIFGLGGGKKKEQKKDELDCGSKSDIDQRRGSARALLGKRNSVSSTPMHVNQIDPEVRRGSLTKAALGAALLAEADANQVEIESGHHKNNHISGHRGSGYQATNQHGGTDSTPVRRGSAGFSIANNGPTTPVRRGSAGQYGGGGGLGGKRRSSVHTIKSMKDKEMREERGRRVSISDEEHVVIG